MRIKPGTEVSTNDCVEVKLNERGLRMLRKHWKSLGASTSAIEHALKAGPTGWHQFQLHELMRIFGRTGTWTTASPFEGCIIRFP